MEFGYTVVDSCSISANRRGKYVTEGEGPIFLNYLQTLIPVRLRKIIFRLLKFLFLSGKLLGRLKI